jgi:hypothetical protein
VDEGGELVWRHDCIGDIFKGDAHVLESVHGRVEVEFFDVDCHEPHVVGGNVSAFGAKKSPLYSIRFPPTVNLPTPHPLTDSTDSLWKSPKHPPLPSTYATRISAESSAYPTCATAHEPSCYPMPSNKRTPATTSSRTCLGRAKMDHRLVHGSPGNEPSGACSQQIDSVNSPL